jgi:hypothetical protein
MSRVLLLLAFAGCDGVFNLDHLKSPRIDGSSDSDGDTQDARVIPNLVARFEFDDNLDDLVPGGPAASCVGASTTCPVYVMPGKHGKAAGFGGSTHCVKFPISGSNSFTISAWIFKTFDQSRAVVAKPYQATSGDSWMIDLDSNFTFRYNTYNGATEDSLTAPAVIADSVWQHLAITYSAVTLTKTIYAEGLAKASKVGIGVAFDTTQPALIGCDHDTSAYSRYFSGSIDDVRIYDVELDSSAIQLLATDSAQ